MQIKTYYHCEHCDEKFDDKDLANQHDRTNHILPKIVDHYGETHLDLVWAKGIIYPELIKINMTDGTTAQYAFIGTIKKDPQRA